MKNKYLKRGRISEHKFKQFLKLFCLDLTATQISKITHLNRNTVNRLINLIRQRMVEICQAQAKMQGIIELDESYFGKRRVRGKRERGAGGKTIVFGLHKRGEQVFTEIVPDAQKRTLQKVIRGRIEPESIIHTDGWRGYNGLVDLGYEKHYRVHNGKNEFARGSCHINEIESFWGFAKHRLAKFQGLPKERVFLHLKESEFRFNFRKKNMYVFLLKELRKNPLN